MKKLRLRERAGTYPGPMGHEGWYRVRHWSSLDLQGRAGLSEKPDGLSEQGVHEDGLAAGPLETMGAQPLKPLPTLWLKPKKGNKKPREGGGGQ